MVCFMITEISYVVVGLFYGFALTPRNDDCHTNFLGTYVPWCRNIAEKKKLSLLPNVFHWITWPNDPFSKQNFLP